MEDEAPISDFNSFTIKKELIVPQWKWSYRISHVKTFWMMALRVPFFWTVIVFCEMFQIFKNGAYHPGGLHTIFCGSGSMKTFLFTNGVFFATLVIKIQGFVERAVLMLTVLQCQICRVRLTHNLVVGMSRKTSRMSHYYTHPKKSLFLNSLTVNAIMSSQWLGNILM